MDDVEAIINGIFVLEKYPGKGGWTYALLPGLTFDEKKPFGWVRVRGSIDDYAFQGVNLMSMGEHKLFLSVRSEIRKKIKKQAGDSVHILLYKDERPTEIPKELFICLKDYPEAYVTFLNSTESYKKNQIEHIYSAKSTSVKETRIASLINQLLS